MQHISDDLPRLLTGDATRDVVLEAAAHLRICVDCQQELVSAVIAHASLTSALRFAPEIVSPETADTSEDDKHDGAELAPVVPLPDLSSMFADVRAETAPAPQQPTHRIRRRLVAVAAAAAVITGGGITYAAVSGNDSAVTRTVALEGASNTEDGKVVLVGSDTMKIDASSLPALDSDHQYEVWLTDDNGQQKQSVGFIDTADRKKEISVPGKLMSQYNNIAVSVQKLRQTEYSGITVLHGTYG